jgi:hypothetical protein
MCWAFDVSIAILTPFTRRASQHASRTHLRTPREPRPPRTDGPARPRVHLKLIIILKTGVARPKEMLNTSLGESNAARSAA